MLSFPKFNLKPSVPDGLENQLSFLITALHGLWSDPLVGSQHRFHADIAKYMLEFTAIGTFALQLQFAVPNITNQSFQYVRCTTHLVFLSLFSVFYSTSVPLLLRKSKGAIHSARVWQSVGTVFQIMTFL